MKKYSAFLWRYEPVRRTGKSDDWLTIFARIIRLSVQKFPLFWVIFCIIIFFIELWHILILWLPKMPNGGMPVFTISIACWLLSRPNLRIVSKLTSDVVTYRYCTEASNQKSKYAYRKIFFYKKALGSSPIVGGLLRADAVLEFRKLCMLSEYCWLLIFLAFIATHRLVNQSVKNSLFNWLAHTGWNFFRQSSGPQVNISANVYE